MVYRSVVYYTFTDIFTDKHTYRPMNNISNYFKAVCFYLSSFDKF